MRRRVVGDRDTTLAELGHPRTLRKRGDCPSLTQVDFRSERGGLLAELRPLATHLAGRRRLARSVPTKILPVNPPAWAALR
jgi:hypothetical protein